MTDKTEEVKAEPLKNKKIYNLVAIMKYQRKSFTKDVYNDIDKWLKENNIMIYREEDIKSAVEWLHLEILKYANDELGGEIREIPKLRKCYDLIDKAFEDVIK